MTRVVVAHPSVDMFELIKDGLDDEFPDDAPEVLFSKNRVDVVERCRRELPHLVIAYIDLSEDRGSSIQRGHGLELVTELRSTYPLLPLILIAPSASAELSRLVQALPGVALVLEGGELESDLRVQVRAALERSITVPPKTPVQRAKAGSRATRRPRSGASREASMRFVIDMHLRNDGHCSYRSHAIGGRVRFDDGTRFNVPPQQLQELIQQSKALALSDDWSHDYRALGRRLREVLITGNLSVYGDLEYIRGLMKDQSSNAIPSIRFITEAGIHSIALEALLDRNEDYWMQHAPIWRQLDLSRSAFPLYEDVDTRKGAVNCLIIESDASGAAAELALEVPRLKGIRDEVDSLGVQLGSQEKGRIGKVGRIWRDESGQVHTSITGRTGKPRTAEPRGSFRTALRALLTGSTAWHIVHYVGHSHYDPKLDRGYVLLPGSPIEVVGASELANWMSRTRFVYMSSCSGSSQDFVFNLCKCNVPAVAGFRYPVDDTSATLYSKTFYEELLSSRSLEDALYRTWTHVYGLDPLNRIWASSEMTIQ